MMLAPIVAGAVLLMPQSAFAENTGWVYTSDGNPGGKGVFDSRSDYMRVCDEQADGYGVVGTITNAYTGKRLAYLRNSQGSGLCSFRGFDDQIPENIGVIFTVCLVDGSGPLRFCRAVTDIVS
ncbi:hypothetical protein AB0L64_39920 [Kribbella sp. NPDC051936]|uniref:hypothetical protein n=1 Tax=Kribbella sp. NPDC051936 TaxID=3154946 RepID=UPI003424CF32